MKRIFLSLFLIVALFLVCTGNASLVAIGTLSTVNNTTTNSIVLHTNFANVVVGTFIVSNNGLASTNALSGARQFSIDGTNWYALGASYIPGVTNAASDTIAPTVISVPIMLRFSVTTTNSVQVGAVYIP